MLLVYIDKIFSLIYLWMNYIIGNYIYKNLYFITPFYFFSILFTIFSIYINNIFSSMVLNEKIRSINIIIVYQKKKIISIFIYICQLCDSEYCYFSNSHSSIEIIARIWSYTTYLSSSHTESMSISKLKKLKINSHGDILIVLIKSFPWQRFQPKHPARRTNTQDQ